MTPFQAIILGTVQGLTEFLPVSSSGHLVLGQHLFGLKTPELLFDVAVHVGTLVAVCIYFFKDIADIVAAGGKRLGNLLKKNTDLVPFSPELRLGMMILVGSVPTAIIGMLLHGMVDVLFTSVLLVGLMLIVTGVWMWFTRGLRSTGLDAAGFSAFKAICIGTIQGLAVIPGISRSGATISAALYLGLNRETAARYSFLLSIPAIVGAALISMRDLSTAGSAHLSLVALGALVSGLVGYGALTFLVYLIKKGNLYLFAPYCWVVGGVCLALSW